MPNTRNVAVIGAGLHRFGRFPDKGVEEIGREAMAAALDQANMPFPEIEAAWTGRVLQGMGAGLRVVSEMGVTGIPVTNIEQACASSTTAIREAAWAVASGLYDRVLVVGFEKMQRGLLQISEQRSYATVMGLAVMPAAYALATNRYLYDHEATPEMFAQVSVKSHRNGALNPNAQYQTPVTLEEVMQSRMIADPITLLECSPTTDGAAAVVLCAEELAPQYTSEWITLAGWASGTGAYAADGEEAGELNNHALTLLANQAYERAGLGPADVDVTQVHDAFAPGEVFAIEALGLTETGSGARAVWDGRTEISGDLPVNTDGGLLSRGHPIGATGCAMVAEIHAQLLGQAGPRQVSGDPKVGLVYNAGIGGMNVMLFKR